MASGTPGDGGKRALTDKEAAFTEPAKRPAGLSTDKPTAANDPSDAAAESLPATQKDVKSPITRPAGERRGVIPPVVDYRRIQQERETKAKPNFFTIYKKGQGYWTRMGTLIGVGLVILFTAHWLYKWLAIWLSWTPAVKDPATGAVSSPAMPDNPFMLGVTAFIIALFFCMTVLGGALSAGIAFGVGVAVAVAHSFGVFGISTTANGHIVWGFLAAYIVSFILFSFRLMNQPRNVDFLIATDSEMKKVNWSTRSELIGSTKVVIGFMLLTAAFLFAVDIFFEEFFYLIGVLRSGPFGK